MLALVKWVGWFGLLLQPPAAQPPAKPADGGGVTANITLRDIDIAEVIEKLELKLGYKLGGKVTAKVSLTVPLNDAGNSKAYTVRGTFTSDELTLEGARAQKVSATLLYADGKLTLTELRASLPPDKPTDPAGEIGGTASAQVDPRGDLSAKLTFTKLPLGEALKAVPGGISASGQVTGTADFAGPLEKLNDPSSWTGSADIASPLLTAFGRTVKDAKAKAKLKDGTATLTDAAGTVEGIPLSGSGTLGLSGKYAFTASVKTNPTEVSELQKLIPEADLPVPIKGKLDTSAKAEGTLNPFAVSASGEVKATELTVGESKPGKLAAKWEVTPERVKVSELDAAIFNGTVTGGVDFPLVPAGKGQVSVKFDKLDSGLAVKTFPATPVKLTGDISGSVVGNIPAADKDGKRPLAADVSLSAPKLTVQNIPARELEGTLKVVGGALEYNLKAKLTSTGSVEISGTYPDAVPGGAAPAPPPAEPKKPGSVVLKNLDLGELAAAFGVKDFPLGGRFTLNFTHGGDFQTGSGTYQLADLTFGTTRIAPQVVGKLRVKEGQLELGDVSGPVIGGTLRARVRASLSQPTRNFVRLDVDRLEAGRLIAAFTGLSADLIEGGISVRARGRVYPEVQVSGTVGMSRGRIAGMTVSDLQLPFTLSARGGGGLVSVKDAVGALGNGRASGRFEYAWGTAGRLDAQVKFTGVRVGNLLSDLRQANFFGGARVTGQIDVSGESVRGAEDLKGTVVLAIQDAATRDLPVLNSVTPFVSPTALTKPFDSGELRGRLSRGVFRIERLVLASPTTDLYADGSVTTAGRLDLGVVVRTGSVGLNDELLTQVGLALPIPGVLPVQLVRDVSVFLSNRTVRMSITGTVSNPQTQVNAAALLADEAVRFFLRRYVPTAAAVLPEVTPRSRR